MGKLEEGSMSNLRGGWHQRWKHRRIDAEIKAKLRGDQYHGGAHIEDKRDRRAENTTRDAALNNNIQI